MKQLMEEVQSFKESVKVSMETLTTYNVELKRDLSYTLDLLRGFVAEHREKDIELLPECTIGNTKVVKTPME